MEMIKHPKAFKKLIQTKRLNLKPLPKPTFKNAQFLYEKFSTQREHFKFLPLSQIKNAEEEYDWLVANERAFKNTEQPSYGLYLRDTGELIGLLGVHAISWKWGRGSLGAWLFKEFAHQGYLTEAVKALEDYMFDLGFHKLIWKACDKNKASCGAARKCGYLKEGVERETVYNKNLNCWENHVVFSKLRSEWKPSKK